VGTLVVFLLNDRNIYVTTETLLTGKTVIVNTEPSIVLPTKYRFTLAKQFQIRRFLEIDQSKTGIASGSYVCKWIKTK
jgi:hypothetical protein